MIYRPRIYIYGRYISIYISIYMNIYTPQLRTAGVTMFTEILVDLVKRL